MFKSLVAASLIFISVSIAQADQIPTNCYIMNNNTLAKCIGTNPNETPMRCVGEMQAKTRGGPTYYQSFDRTVQGYQSFHTNIWAEKIPYTDRYEFIREVSIRASCERLTNY